MCFVLCVLCLLRVYVPRIITSRIVPNVMYVKRSHPTFLYHVFESCPCHSYLAFQAMGRDKSVSGNPIAPVPSPSWTQPKDQLVIPRLWAGPTRYQGSRCRSLCPPLQRDLHGAKSVPSLRTNSPLNVPYSWPDPADSPRTAP